MSDEKTTDTAAETSVEVTEVQADDTAKIDADATALLPVPVPVPRPEDIIVTKHQEAVFASEGIELNPNTQYPLIAEIAALAYSPDLIQTQLSIYAYETGNTSLYRVLNSVLIIGDHIKAYSDADIKAALGNFKQIITDEEAAAKAENRKPRGFKNLGAVSLPIINDKFITQSKYLNY